MGEDCRKEQEEIHSTKHVLDMLQLFVMWMCLPTLQCKWFEDLCTAIS